jgi:hypothetical protein
MPSLSPDSPEFNSQSGSPSSSRQETRRGWANCYPVRTAQSTQPPDYAGITVLPELGKYWVRVWLRDGFVSVQVAPAFATGPKTQDDAELKKN